jgi:hypothetical protein
MRLWENSENFWGRNLLRNKNNLKYYQGHSKSQVAVLQFLTQFALNSCSMCYINILHHISEPHLAWSVFYQSGAPSRWEHGLVTTWSWYILVTNIYSGSWSNTNSPILKCIFQWTKCVCFKRPLSNEIGAHVDENEVRFHAERWRRLAKIIFKGHNIALIIIYAVSVRWAGG